MISGKKISSPLLQNKNIGRAEAEFESEVGFDEDNYKITTTNLSQYPQNHWSALLKLSLAVLVIFNVSLFCFTVSNGGIRGSKSPAALYSPAHKAVKDEIKKFHRGFDRDKTIYQEKPSKEVDEAWEFLYDDVGIIRIPESEAKQLPNKTYPIPNDEGYWIGELAVFHQLHCLNIIRQVLHKDYYEPRFESGEFGVDGDHGAKHVSHCLDALREAVMCASDISVIVWQWNEKAQKALGHGDIVHQCRNFNQIWMWSRDHKTTVEFDASVYMNT